MMNAEQGHMQPSSLRVGIGAQVIGVAILEFGVVLHRSVPDPGLLTIEEFFTMCGISLLIGLTLAVTPDRNFKLLFVVLCFHRE